MKFCKKITAVTCLIAILASPLRAAAQTGESPLKPPEGYDGFVTVSAEAFTLGWGYIAEPTHVPFREGESIADVVDRMLTENKIAYKAGGTVEDGFYLKAIQCGQAKNGEKPKVPEFIMKELERTPGQWTGEPDGDDMLGEAEYSTFGGWAIADNDAGTMDVASSLPAAAGHVYRCMFTVYGYGMDLGLNDGWGMFPAFENPAAGVLRSEAGTLYADIRADEGLKKLVSKQGGANAEFNEFKAALENLSSTQEEIDDKEAALIAAIEKSAYETAYSGALSYISGKTPAFGAAGCGEWAVFTLARSGQKDLESGYFADYYKHIEKTVKENGGAKLHPRKSTENSRLVIALSGMGKDARDVAGYNLVEPLYDFDYVSSQGVNGQLYALMALCCFDGYAEGGIKAKLVDEILAHESEGGGWSESGAGVNCDLTAIAITALSPFEKAKPAVERAIGALSRAQQSDGGFLDYGEENADSASQVVIALCSAGVDAGKDGRFIKDGNSALSALLRFYTGTGFSHLKGGDVNGMATEQAAEALCAYDRFIKGGTPLFDLSDVSFDKAREKAGRPSWALPLIIVVFAVVLLSAIYFFKKPSAKNNKPSARGEKGDTDAKRYQS